MTPTVRFSVQSKIDLVEILDYIDRHNSIAAERIIKGLVNSCHNIGDNPHSGRSREELGSGVRGLPVGKYTIFYETQSGHIDILRILHSARDVDELMKKS